MAIALERKKCSQSLTCHEEGAKQLPYRELLGVINYPCTFTKLEMRFYVSRRESEFR